MLWKKAEVICPQMRTFNCEVRWCGLIVSSDDVQFDPTRLTDIKMPLVQKKPGS